VPGILRQARDAIPSIVEIKLFLETRQSPRRRFGRFGTLDERYLRAVGYSTKSKRGALPKMVLLGDIVGEDDGAVAAAASEVVRIANARAGEVHSYFHALWHLFVLAGSVAHYFAILFYVVPARPDPAQISLPGRS